MAIVKINQNATRSAVTGSTRELDTGDAAIGGECVCCDGVFVEGDRVAPILIGACDEHEREKASHNAVYLACWVFAHAVCVRS